VGSGTGMSLYALEDFHVVNLAGCVVKRSEDADALLEEDGSHSAHA